VPRGRFARAAGLRARGTVTTFARRVVTALLDLLVVKPIAVFVWWLSNRANSIDFAERGELRRRIGQALREGRPVLIACNHLSWFDDPVIPMAIFRTGERSMAELAVIAIGVLLCWGLPDGGFLEALAIAATVLAAVGSACCGAHKAWWTLGDLVNLSDASVLRGKLELVRGQSPGSAIRVALKIADVAIRSFMRTETVRTIFVDRRPGEQARSARLRAFERTLEIAARPETIWVFFEGGRSRVPGRIAPARHGIGSLALALTERGFRPLLIAVSHRGMERVIPPGASRFLSSGHRVAARWNEVDVGSMASEHAGHPQGFADAVREEVVRLQAELGMAGSGDA
jgi:1-acyl-sn-glycerol-3-phosphate acyltransferase